MLIRKGAEIYLNPNSILENFGFSIENIEELIINQLKIGKQDLENLQIMTGYNSTLIQKSLLKLILEGRIFFDGEYYLV
jgi:predicted Rossmann fold nucleotide-binding protein DprA/Smf involved in DNA uptake